MNKRERDFLSMQDVLNQMIQTNNLEKGLEQIKIQEVWEDVMGEGVKNYTESVTLKKGTLIVKLKSATLREELSYGKSKIVAIINDAANKNIINEIKLL